MWTMCSFCDLLITSFSRKYINKVFDMDVRFPWADEDDNEKEKLSQTQTNNRQQSISGTHLHLLRLTSPRPPRHA